MASPTSYSHAQGQNNERRNSASSGASNETFQMSNSSSFRARNESDHPYTSARSYKMSPYPEGYQKPANTFNDRNEGYIKPNVNDLGSLPPAQRQVQHGNIPQNGRTHTNKGGGEARHRSNNNKINNNFSDGDGQIVPFRNYPQSNSAFPNTKQVANDLSNHDRGVLKRM